MFNERERNQRSFGYYVPAEFNYQLESRMPEIGLFGSGGGASLTDVPTSSPDTSPLQAIRTESQIVKRVCLHHSLLVKQKHFHFGKSESLRFSSASPMMLTPFLIKLA